MSPNSIIKKFLNQLLSRNHQSNKKSYFQSNDVTEFQSYLYFLIIICFFLAFYYCFYCHHFHYDVLYNNFFHDFQDLFLYLFDSNKIILRIVKMIVNKTIKLIVLLLLLMHIIYLPLETFNF